MPPELSISPLVAGEEYAVFRLVQSVFDQTLREGSGQEGAEAFYHFVQPDQLRHRHLNESTICKLCLGKELVGMFELEHTHLRLFFIDPRYHGKGYARAAIRWIQQSLVEQNYPRKITLFAAPTAIPVYERMGFRRVGEQISQGGLTVTPMVCTF